MVPYILKIHPNRVDAADTVSNVKTLKLVIFPCLKVEFQVYGHKTMVLGMIGGVSDGNSSKGTKDNHVWEK